MHDVGLNDVRMVVADVDGTLVTPEKILTPRARAVVRAIVEAGIAFTITSGRPPGAFDAASTARRMSVITIVGFAGVSINTARRFRAERMASSSSSPA